MSLFRPAPLALYLHFPYCLYKCHYCDFNSYAVEWSQDLEERYLLSLLQEIKLTFEALPPFQIRSVFLGGGTPSLFSPRGLEKVLTELSHQAERSPSCEITIEMNPKTLTAEKIKGYLQIGINRFSLGVQSFEEAYLSPLGRLHTGEEAKEAAELLAQTGAQNFNLDLMFGFSGQSPAQVLKDLKTAISFNPQHLSFYNLTLEEGTKLKSQFQKKLFTLPDNDIQAEMYDQGIHFLEKNGYSLYEISNFCRKASVSQHNLSYWRYEDYLGLGAGAVSFLKYSHWGTKNENIYGLRWTNPKTPKEYQEYIKSPQPPFTKGGGRKPHFSKGGLGGILQTEEISYPTAQAEFWMMGLRLTEGVSLLEFEKRFGESSAQPYSKIISSLEQKSWISLKEDRVQLTGQGRFFANDVVTCFI